MITQQPRQRALVLVGSYFGVEATAECEYVDSATVYSGLMCRLKILSMTVVTVEESALVTRRYYLPEGQEQHLSIYKHDHRLTWDQLEGENG